MESELGFVQQRALTLLLLLPLFVFCLWKLYLRREEALSLLSASRLTGGMTSRSSPLRLLLPLILVLLLVIAAARPFNGYEKVLVPTLHPDLMWIVDVSNSMLAEDVSPSRLGFAKHKLEDLLQLIRQRGPGTRVGIVLFAGQSYLYCPPTPDLNVVTLFLRSISPGLISEGGSDIVGALQTALKSFTNIAAQSPHLLLISDGEDLESEAAEVKKVLRSYQVPISTLGIGTPQGGPIPISGGQLLKDRYGQIVITKLDEGFLQKIAAQSGGLYRHATLGDADISTLLDSFSLSDAHSRSAEQERTLYHELGPYFVWACLAIVAMLFIGGRKSLVLVLLLCLGAVNSFAEAPPTEPAAKVDNLYDAYRAYEAGHFQEALPRFLAEHQRDPTDAKVAQALGSTYFKLGKFDEAKKIFGALAQTAENGREKFASEYDLGSAELASKNYKPAVEAFNRALAVKPGDAATQFNRDLAKKLEEEAPRQQKQDQKDHKQNQEKQNSEQQQQKQDQQKQQEQQQNKSQQSKQQHDQEQNEAKNNSDSDRDQKSDDKNDQKQKESGNEAGNKDATPSPTPRSPAKDDEGEGSGATPTPSPSDANSGNGSSPSPSASPTNENSQGISENATPSPTLGNSTQVSAGQTNASNEGSSGQHELTGSERRALTKSESKAWLDSLGETPLLLQRKTGRSRNQRGQTW